MQNKLASIFLILPCLLLNGAYLFAQDTIYLDEYRIRTSDISQASFFEINRPDSLDNNLISSSTYNMSGTLLETRINTNDTLKYLEGISSEYYSNGSIKRSVEFKKNKINGKVLTWWPSGQAKRVDQFEDNKFVEGICYDLNGNVIPHFDFEQMPEFPGGERKLFEFLQKNIRYPKDAREFGIQGRVYAQFVIDKKGQVTRISILRSVHPDLDAEALRVVKMMPEWKAGLRDGELVSVHYKLPINFSLR